MDSPPISRSNALHTSPSDIPYATQPFPPPRSHHQPQHHRHPSHPPSAPILSPPNPLSYIPTPRPRSLPLPLPIPTTTPRASSNIPMPSSPLTNNPCNNRTTNQSSSVNNLTNDINSLHEPSNYATAPLPLHSQFPLPPPHSVSAAEPHISHPPPQSMHHHAMQPYTGPTHPPLPLSQAPHHSDHMRSLSPHRSVLDPPTDTNLQKQKDGMGALPSPTLAPPHMTASSTLPPPPFRTQPLRFSTKLQTLPLPSSAMTDPLPQRCQPYQHSHNFASQGMLRHHHQFPLSPSSLPSASAPHRAPLYDISKLLVANCTIVQGRVYNDKGHNICGVLNQHDKPCRRIGKCPFHFDPCPVTAENSCNGYVDPNGDVPASKQNIVSPLDSSDTASPHPSHGSTLNGVLTAGNASLTGLHSGGGAMMGIGNVSNNEAASSPGGSSSTTLHTTQGITKASTALRPPKKMQYKHGWSKDEHFMFLKGLQKYNRGSWKQISLFVKTRTPTQVQSHAQKFFLRQKQDVKNKRSIHDLSIDSPEMQEVAKRFRDMHGHDEEEIGGYSLVGGSNPMGQGQMDISLDGGYRGGFRSRDCDPNIFNRMRNSLPRHNNMDFQSGTRMVLNGHGGEVGIAERMGRLHTTGSGGYSTHDNVGTVGGLCNGANVQGMLYSDSGRRDEVGSANGMVKREPADVRLDTSLSKQEVDERAVPYERRLGTGRSVYGGQRDMAGRQLGGDGGGHGMAASGPGSGSGGGHGDVLDGGVANRHGGMDGYASNVVGYGDGGLGTAGLQVVHGAEHVRGGTGDVHSSSGGEGQLNWGYAQEVRQKRPRDGAMQVAGKDATGGTIGHVNGSEDMASGAMTSGAMGSGAMHVQAHVHAVDEEFASAMFTGNETVDNGDAGTVGTMNVSGVNGSGSVGVREFVGNSIGVRGPTSYNRYGNSC